MKKKGGKCRANVSFLSDCWRIVKAPEFSLGYIAPCGNNSLVEAHPQLIISG